MAGQLPIRCFPRSYGSFGCAITLSLGKRIAAGVPKSRLFLQVLRRAAVIFGLGLIVYAAPDFNLSTQRLLGVLQRIAICYLNRIRDLSDHALARPGGLDHRTAGLLLADHDAAAGAGLWRWRFGNWPQHCQTTWIVSYWARIIMRVQRIGIRKASSALCPRSPPRCSASWPGHILKLKRDLSERTTWLYLAGSILIAVGLICNTWLPINKKLWTSSFSLFMGGMDFVIFAGFVWLIDGRGYQRYVRPLVIMGMNAIAVYLASELWKRC